MTFFRSLSAAGFAATAISYGPARMGFGLFVPEFKAAFDLSTASVGLISSLGFAGFFVGLLVAQQLLDRRGPMAPVLAGMGAATLGLAVVAMAPTAPVLALGVITAALSAGFAWTPFNDAVHRKVRGVDRPTALSEISTGTSVGIATTGGIAVSMVLFGLDWRLCWLMFSVAAVLTFVGNWAALRQVEPSPETRPRRSWRKLMTPGAGPLYVVAFVYGITSAIYISFAPDQFARGGVSRLPEGVAPSLVFIIYGLFGLSGLLTGKVRDKIGLTRLLQLLLAAGAGSLILAGAFPGHFGGLAISAALQGGHVMMTSAVLAFWSERLFPAFPSLGFTTALLATAAGSVAGPVLAGLVAQGLGSTAMLLAAALIPLAGAGSLRRRIVSDGPLVTPKGLAKGA
jgi:predicted MFS family arabinose efflux permease